MLTYIEKESLKNKFITHALDDILLRAVDELIVMASHKRLT